MPSSCSDRVARPDTGGSVPLFHRGRLWLAAGFSLGIAIYPASGAAQLPIVPAPANPGGTSPTPETAVATETTTAATEQLKQDIEQTLRDTLPDLAITDAEVTVLNANGDWQSLAASLSETPRWRFFVVVENTSTGIDLDVAAVPAGSRVVALRSDHTTVDQVQVRTIALARDLVHAHIEKPSGEPARDCPPCRTQTRTRSSGRAVLVFNTALIGAYAGYSIQRAGGSSDARLTYPLLALGTGIGIGAGMVVAEEWDVGYGDAWYFSAGAMWPTLSALLLAEGYQTRPEDARFMIGLGGTLGGMSLATFVLASSHVSEGSAALAHSGGAIGLLLGGLGEMTIRGRTGFIPERGMGYGAAAGVLVAGAAGPLGFKVAPSQVLMMDLGAGLGSLVAAAAASPLVALGDASEDRHRLWLASVAVGTIAGAVVGYSLTTGGDDRASLPQATPFASYLPAHEGEAGSFHLGMQGTW
jgi:hypothetical protein